MAVWPISPLPSSVSAPAYIDPMLTFVSDSGYETRRSLHSRPRRRYTLDYLGKSTAELRIIADFLQATRFGAGQQIEFYHPTASDIVVASNTTPIWLFYNHALPTGAYVYVGSPPALEGIWHTTRIAPNAHSLDGSVAHGDIYVQVQVYIPYVVARMSDDTWESPTKLVGTDMIGPDRPGATVSALAGRWSFSVTLEEVF
jgi:hypothetical protein